MLRSVWNEPRFSSETLKIRAKARSKQENQYVNAPQVQWRSNRSSTIGSMLRKVIMPTYLPMIRVWSPKIITVFADRDNWRCVVIDETSDHLLPLIHDVLADLKCRPWFVVRWISEPLGKGHGHRNSPTRGICGVPPLVNLPSDPLLTELSVLPTFRRHTPSSARYRFIVASAAARSCSSSLSFRTASATSIRSSYF